jgi:hypothetical protein
MRLAITSPDKTGDNCTRLESAPVVALGYAASITVLIALTLSIF